MVTVRYGVKIILMQKGKKLKILLITRICVFLNTYLHPGHGTYSAIDIAICVPELVPFSRPSALKNTS